MTYKLAHRGKIYDVAPLGRWTLKSETPEKCAGFRLLFDGKLTFQDKDFEIIKEIEQENLFAEIEIIIYEFDKEYWRGMFSPILGEFDNYKGVFIVTPIVKDKYSGFLQDWEREIDLMGLGAEGSVISIEAGVVVETREITKRYVRKPDYIWQNWVLEWLKWRAGVYASGDEILPTAIHSGNIKKNFGNSDTSSTPTWFQFFIPAIEASPNLYVLPFPLLPLQLLFTNNGTLWWQQQWLLVDLEKTNSSRNDDGTFNYAITYTFKREVKITYNSQITGSPLLPKGGDDEWSLAWKEPTTILGRPATKFYRSAQFYMQNYNITQNQVWFSITSLKFKFLNNIQTRIQTFNLINSFNALLENSKEYSNVPQKDDKPILCASGFFQYTENPITNEAPNPFLNASLVWNDYLNGERYDFETAAGNISIKDLLLSVCNNFNLLWDIQISGGIPTLVIEHFKDWQSNEKLDLTARPEIKHLENFKYNGDTLVRTFNLTYSEKNDDIEFDGVPIEYNVYATSSLLEDKSEKLNISAYGVNPTKVIKDNTSSGYTLLALNSDNKIIRNEGIITGMNYVNEPLAISRVLQNYYTIGQKLNKGIVNGVEVEFTESGYVKSQSVKVPIGIENLEKSMWIKTNSGWGRLEGFQVDSVNRLVTLSIILQ